MELGLCVASFLHLHYSILHVITQIPSGFVCFFPCLSLSLSSLFYVQYKAIREDWCHLEHALRQGQQHILRPHLSERQRLACLAVIAVMGGVGHHPTLGGGLLVRTNLARGRFVIIVYCSGIL